MAGVSSIVLRDGARVFLAAGNVFVDLSGASFHLWGEGSPFGAINARHRIEAVMLGGDDASCTVITQTGERFVIGVKRVRTLNRHGCITVRVTDDHGNRIGEIVERLWDDDDAFPEGGSGYRRRPPRLLN